MISAMESGDLNILNRLLNEGLDASLLPFPTPENRRPMSKESIKLVLQRGKFTQERLDQLIVGLAYEPEYAEILLRRGADINSRGVNNYGNVYEQTPLGGVAGRGITSAVQFLVSKGAKVDLEGPLRNTPLISAAEHGNPDTIRVLLMAGADIRKENICGCSALIAAAAEHKAENVKALLKAGADPNTRDHRSRATVRCKEIHRMRHRIDDGPVDGTALMWAAYSRDTKAVEYLRDAGANVNAKDANGISARRWAASPEMWTNLSSPAGAKHKEAERQLNNGR